MYKVIRTIDDIVDYVFTLVFILLMLIGVYFVYDTAYVYYNASAARVAYYRPGTEEAAAEDVKPLLDDYVAWLNIDGTQIDFPLMQGENNSKYLNTDPYGDFSLAGSIFLDSRNARDFSDPYSLLYGHHMSGGFMFGALDRYYEEDYFQQHGSGTLTVGELVYPLEIFAMLTTDADDMIIFQPGDSEAVLERAKEISIFYKEPISDHLLAMTTCVDSYSITRTIVLCALGEPYTEGRDGA